jgi:hypothetical protein
MEAYIDESGDEGTGGRGSRWLVFGCAMASASELPLLASTVDAASAILGHRSGRGRRRIHFRRLAHHDKRGVLKFLAIADWLAIIVASDTTSITPGSYLVRPEYQYNYALRYVIERVSQRAEEIREAASIYIDSRRNFDLQRFRTYMILLKNRGAPRIRWQYVDPGRIYTATHAQRPNLALADGLAHAGFKALEPDEWWGHNELAYLDEVKGRLWRGPAAANRIHDYGFVLMPTPSGAALLQSIPGCTHYENALPRWTSEKTLTSHPLQA